MKIYAQRQALAGDQMLRGLTLFECLVYLAMFFLIMGLAYGALYRTWEHSKSLNRATQDIARAAGAGELWREDIRSATGPLRVEDSADGPTIYIPQKTGEVLYRFTSGEVQRRPGGQTAWSPLIAGVKSSRMQADARARVTAWRWELELEKREKSSARTTPLFTFEAVPNLEASR